ncbi:hypothetical protein ACJIZ3_019975 [Penstemon smallii]|uniref:Uncharacterized protein n=1 Tax=Penstemon smallii TaxID=265156 RepID=A0ABD3S6T5_9LAMI
MIELEDKSIEEGETPMSEDEILAEALGHRFENTTATLDG